MGRGFTGTTIKDTWAKPKGSVEGGGGEVGLAGVEWRGGEKCRQL